MNEKDFQKPMGFEKIKALTEKYILNTYRRAPVAFYFGQGEYLYDTEQKRYIDFLSGIGVTCVGHGEADIVEAIRTQADRLLHTSNLFYNEEQAILAEIIVNNTFPGALFFCNSGTEANEAAFKLSRTFGQKARGGSINILALENSFHGRSAASLTLTGKIELRRDLGPLLPGVTYIPPNDIEALEHEIESNGSEICAVFLELIQGEGGVIPLERDYVFAVRELTRDYNILLVVDEVQTGIGRTGNLFAFQHYDIVPDIVTMAKALGNGFPIGAMLVRENFRKYMGPGKHGSTFGGNHLAARVAFETMRVIMSRELLKNVNTISDYLFRRLKVMQNHIKIIKDVRGLGLLIGIELNRPGDGLVRACLQNGLLINCTAERTIRLMPPLNISMDRAAEALDILEEMLEKEQKG